MSDSSFNPDRGTPRRDSIDAIIYDLSDRRGLKWAWEGTDDDIQEEIKQAWRNILQTEKDPQKAVDLIIKDLSGRRGFRQEWEQIDEDIQEEVRQTWIELISSHS